MKGRFRVPPKRTDPEGRYYTHDEFREMVIDAVGYMTRRHEDHIKELASQLHRRERFEQMLLAELKLLRADMAVLSTKLPDTMGA